MKRRRSIEIYSPVLGFMADQMPELLDPRAVCSGQNFKNYFGINQKEYGTSLFATATSAVLTSAPTHIFAATFPQIGLLEVHTPTNVFEYNSGSDNFTNDGQTFTGTYTDFWSSLMYNSAYIYTNGKDPMQIKTIYNATGTNLASAVSPTTFNAWCVQANNAILCLYHVFENGTEFYKRVRWSAQGPLNYAAGTTDFATGIAGAQDIDDGEGVLETALPLAGGIVLYFQNSIHFQYFIGGNAVWQFQKMIPGVGVPGRRCAVAYQEVNYLLTFNNIYRYFGGYYLDPIGESVKRAIFSELNPGAIGNSFLDFDKKEGELLVNIPTGTATQPNVTWVYRVADKAWSRKLRQHCSSTVYGKTTGLTIGQLKGSIAAQNYTYGEAAVTQQADIKLYGDPGGYVVKHDFTVYSVSQTGTSVPQVYVYDTPDLTGNKTQDNLDGDQSEFVATQQRWQRLSAELLGNGSGHIYYSTDHGNTYREFDASPVSLVSIGTTHLLDMDVTSPFVRIRFSNSGLNEFMAVRYVKLDFLPGPNY